MNSCEGILLVDKPKGRTSFSLVSRLRRCLGVQKIGHAGTLDPFATGVMVMLIGKNYTRKSDQFLSSDKEYVAKLVFGSATDSYDTEGMITMTSGYIPTLEEINACLLNFNGTIDQVPPMFSAKKVGGKKLYDLARKGIEIERKPEKVTVKTELIAYTYPYLELKIACSKGTYVRSIAHDIGLALGCYAHLGELQRTRSGSFQVNECIDGELLYQDIEKQTVVNFLLKEK